MVKGLAAYLNFLVIVSGLVAKQGGLIGFYEAYLGGLSARPFNWYYNLLSGVRSYFGCRVNYNLSEDSDNIIGVVGDSFHCFLRYKGFGLASIIIPIIILLWGLGFLKGINNREHFKKLLIKSLHLLGIMIFFSWESNSFVVSQNVHCCYLIN